MLVLRSEKRERVEREMSEFFGLLKITPSEENSFVKLNVPSPQLLSGAVEV